MCQTCLYQPLVHREIQLCYELCARSVAVQRVRANDESE